jgi:hypothetical protein
MSNLAVAEGGKITRYLPYTDPLKCKTTQLLSNWLKKKTMLAFRRKSSKLGSKYDANVREKKRHSERHNTIPPHSVLLYGTKQTRSIGIFATLIN